MMPAAATESSDDRAKARALYARALHGWNGLMKNMVLYSPEHPALLESAQKFVLQLRDILRVRSGFSVQNSDGLLHVDSVLLIEGSLSLYDLLHHMEKQDINKVLFMAGVTEAEVLALTAQLLKKRAEGEKFVFRSEHISVVKEIEIRLHDEHKKAAVMLRRAESLFDEWLQLGEAAINKLLDEQILSIPELSTPMERLIDALNQSPNAFCLMLASHPGASLHTTHAVRSMIYSLHVGSQLGYDATTMKLLGVSALLHDVGRWLLPSDFNAGCTLAAGDSELIQLHACDGATFLAGVPGLPICAVRAALEHHIGPDGKGYPAIGETSLHPFSEIIAIADFVSWGTVSDRYYQKTAPLHRLVRSLLRRSGTQFHPLLVKLFLPFLGLYPPGTKVRLTSGETAISVEPNLRNILRPATVTPIQNGDPAFHWLGSINKDSEAFTLSVAAINGAHGDLAPLVAFLPDLDDSKTS